NAGNTQRSGDGAPITPGTWRHLALVAKNNQIALYVDGNPFSTLAATLPTMTGPSQLGRGGAAPVADHASAVAAPAAAGETPATPAGDVASAPPSTAAAVGFAGDVDEFHIAKVARPAGFIKL